jgi:predicted nucleotidyltransferase
MNKYLQKSLVAFDKSIRARLKPVGDAPKIDRYIQEIVGTAECFLGYNSIHSVILFGSIAHRQTARVSDVDLLIIVNNSISRTSIKKVKPILDAIEIKHEFGRYAEKWYSSILRVVEKTTGMFCSHFVCRLEDWDNENFARIFSTNRPLTYLLAPDEIVLGSMKSGAVLLAGDADLSNKRRVYPRKQLIKSLFMNLSISIGALVIMPLNPRNMKYVLEGYKWSLQSAYFFLRGTTISLRHIIKFFVKLGASPAYNRQFLAYRQNLLVDSVFVVKTFFQINKIYHIAMKQNKVKNWLDKLWSIFGV